MGSMHWISLKTMGWLLASVAVFYTCYLQGVGSAVDCDHKSSSHSQNSGNLDSARQPRVTSFDSLPPCVEGQEQVEEKREKKAKAKATCSRFDSYGQLSLYKHVLPKADKAHPGAEKAKSVLSVAYSQLHHPDSPAKAEFMLAAPGTLPDLRSGGSSGSALSSSSRSASSSGSGSTDIPAAAAGVGARIFSGDVSGAVSAADPWAACQQLYLTRSGCRDSMPNKCVAVIMVPGQLQASLSPSSEEGKKTKVAPAAAAAAPAAEAGAGTFNSPYHHSHRIGEQAHMVNQYTNDWPTHKELAREAASLTPILKGLPVLVKQVRSILGEPLRPDGSRRTSIVMVANEGVRSVCGSGTLCLWDPLWNPLQH